MTPSAPNEMWLKSHPTVETDERRGTLTLRVTLFDQRDDLWHDLLQEHAKDSRWTDCDSVGGEIDLQISEPGDVGACLEWLSSAVPAVDERRKEAKEAQRRRQTEADEQVDRWYEGYLRTVKRS